MVQAKRTSSSVARTRKRPRSSTALATIVKPSEGRVRSAAAAAGKVLARVRSAPSRPELVVDSCETAGTDNSPQQRAGPQGKLSNMLSFEFDVVLPSEEGDGGRSTRRPSSQKGDTYRVRATRKATSGGSDLRQYHGGYSEIDLARAEDQLSEKELEQTMDRVAKRVFGHITKRWKLEDVEAVRLLGTDVGRRCGVRQGHWDGALEQPQLRRISALIGVYEALHKCFSADLGVRWLRQPNTDSPYAGLRPLSYMTQGGLRAIVRTRDYLEALEFGL